MATAVVLVAGAGLLLRTLVAVETFDRGYRATEVLTMLVDPLGDRYPTPESLLQFYDAVRRETTTIPGVAAVAWTSDLPLTASDARNLSFEIVGDPAIDERPAAGRRQPPREPRVTSTRSSCRSSPDAPSAIATRPTARRCAW